LGAGTLEAFDKAERLLSELADGCTRRTGQPCVAGNQCFCRSSSSDVVAEEKQGEASHESDENHGFTSYELPIQDSVPSGGMDGNLNSGVSSRRERTRPSFRMSFGGPGGLGRFSMASETTFGRAMSGLSALSIDWENMDDFDVTVDHSEGINNDVIQSQQQLQEGQMNQARGYQEDELRDGVDSKLIRVAHHFSAIDRRSSLRKSTPVMPNGGTAHVSFG
jgi:hypothetical protein